MRWFVGTKVKVNEGSGLDSGKIGKIVAQFEVKTDGRGIPTNVQGAYKPVDWRREVAIRLIDSEEIITMFKSHITEVKNEDTSGDFFRETVVFEHITYRD